MQFIYKSRPFDIIINFDSNQIVATYTDPQKINYSKDNISGTITKTIAYSDILSFSIPISENYKSGDPQSKLFEDNNLCFTTIFGKLCSKIDEHFK